MKHVSPLDVLRESISLLRFDFWILVSAFFPFTSLFVASSIPLSGIFFGASDLSELQFSLAIISYLLACICLIVVFSSSLQSLAKRRLKTRITALLKPQKLPFLRSAVVVLLYFAAISLLTFLLLVVVSVFPQSATLFPLLLAIIHVGCYIVAFTFLFAAIQENSILKSLSLWWSSIRKNFTSHLVIALVAMLLLIFLRLLEAASYSVLYSIYWLVPLLVAGFLYAVFLTVAAGLCAGSYKLLKRV